ncbi:FG-GAP repeat protein [Stieleria maiorica]|uniref:FG-GAP repeat protein n=1 Tax=Stieleria maiorica TaxID=2795974 RepID=A0A5B9MI41_9BACT|nr:choice-of-anchor M domain-containing protein [Stieleria maiorica]QEF99255.1 FG-GAP repeat protein [Stieleria maiorica]
MTDGISEDDALWMLDDSHSHYNFGFSKPGRYEVDVKVSGYFGDDGLATANAAGLSKSQEVTLYFSVISVGQLQFGADSYAVDEDAGTASIDVIRGGGSDGRVTVNYATSNGTADAGQDYTATTGTLEFLDGETVKTIAIPITEELVGEGDETFQVTLSSPTPANMNGYLVDVEGDANGLLGQTTTAVVTIADGAVNTPPTLAQIDDQFVAKNGSTGSIALVVGDAETAVADLVVTATSSNTTVVPEGNITLGGNGADRTITITPGADQIGSTTITVTVTDGSGLQTSESFELNVSGGLVPFGMASHYGGDSMQRLAVADFTGDGTPDVVSVAGYAGSMTFMEGIGDGGFLAPIGINADAGLFVGTFSTTDFDGDNDLDFIIAEYTFDTVTGAATDGELVLYRNDGAGQFSRTVLRQGLPAVNRNAAGDINADGRPDVVYSKGSTSLVLQTQNAAGELEPEIVLASLSSRASVVLEDIDNDGDLDIVASDSSAGTLLVFVNDGAGNFGTPQTLTAEVGRPSLEEVVDLNGDGRPDLIVKEGSSPTAGYYPQTADGSFGGRVELPINARTIDSLSTADFNGDGILDVGFTNRDWDDAYSYFDFNVGWLYGKGGGGFGPSIVAQRFASVSYDFATADLDGDSDPDIVAAVLQDPGVAVLLNQSAEDPMRFIAPEARTYTAGDPIDLQIFFGLPITVTGTPRIALTLGAETVYAEYAAGSGTSTLQFTYQVADTDVDLDGVQLASNVIDLNGGTLSDPLGSDAALQFPTTVLEGVIVNAVGPVVAQISRIDTTPTESEMVRFRVEFAEAVEGVDVVDFDAQMFDGDISGATIESVTGSGDTYELTVSTGTGSGVLALSVKESATITDLQGDPLARGYVGGEVYTLRRSAPGPIDVYYTKGHGDYRPVLNGGQLTYVLHGDPAEVPSGEVPSDEISTYVDSTGIVNRPEDQAYEFLGVGGNEPLYVIPNIQSPTLPFLGFSGESVPEGAFASYVPDHPNVTSSSARPYIKLEMLDVRSTSGGEFSMWSNPPSWNPSAGVSVYMATSDGISDADALFLRVGSHGHFNVGFSEPGVYEVDVFASGYLDNDRNGEYDPLKDNYIESGIVTMVFAVDTLGAMDDSFSVYEGETLTGDVSANDEWHAAMGDYAASVETDPAHGTLSLDADGSFTYQPDAGFTGTDSFTYRVTNERGGFTTATATIGVSANRLVPFAMPQYHGGAFASGTWGQTTGDFNGDGNVDLIVAGDQQNSLTFMQGNGDGTFQAEQLLNPNTDVRSQGLTAVDYDGDGDWDLLVYEYNQATVDGTADEATITLYRNDGAANFSREILFGGLIQGYWIDAGDVNGDGRVDVAYSGYRYISSTRTIVSEKAVVLQQSDGTLGDKTVLTDDYYGEFIMEDVDGDGHQDVVSTGSVFDSTTFTSTSYLQLFRGNGDGTFQSPLDVNSNANPKIYQVIDLNGDGLKDLLVSDRGTESHLGYYPQLEGGSFAERVTLTPGYLYSQLSVATEMNGDGVPDIVSYSYKGGYQVTWSPGLGGGAFGDPILVSSDVINGELHVADVDNDSYPDIINSGGSSATRLAPVGIFLNKTGEDPMVLLPPAARTRIGGDPIELQIYFGFPIEVSGTPRVPIQVGENTVYADYISGSGTPFLSFRYTIADTDIDLDGVQLAGNVIDLNGATLTDPVGGDAVLEFPNVLFDGVFVNAVGPLVRGITRLESTPTDVDSVRFEIEFAEEVTNVDASDFEVVMNAGDLAGAVIDSVTGSGNTYVVTVLTGTGSGTLALSVKDDASLTNMEGDPLARGYFGGEVYTLRRGTPEPIEHYFSDQHADCRPVWNDGEMTLAIHGAAEVIPGGEISSDAIYTYADSNALVERPDDAAYDFVGVDAGQSLYVLPSSQVPGVPFLGFTNGDIPSGLFASYVPDDPRVTSSTPRPYLRYEMTDMRSSSGGEFSLWSTPSSGPRVYMTTSDGISSEDVLWSSGHLHRNLGFSKPGTYEVDVFISGYLDVNANGVYDEGLDPYYESGIQTMVFAVDTLGATDDVFFVADGETLGGDVSVNDDWHASMGDYTASVETDPTNGTLTLHADGSFSYQTHAGFTGTDSFTYRVTNQRGGFTTATVTLAGTHSPIVNDDSYSVDEDGSLTVGGDGVLGNDVDADGDVLKAALVSAPLHGSLVLNPDGSFEYVPEANFFGTDSFTYTATDVQYQVTALGTLGGNTSFALDVNNLNQVTGNSGIVSGSSNPLHAFRWTDGELIDLGVVEGTGDNNFSRGYAINDAGVVVGESDNSASKAFRWENGVIANLGTLGGTSAVASDINNLGQIVGSSSNGAATKPFVYVDGLMLELPTIAGNAASTGRAWGISPDGRFIVGVTRADDAEFLSHASLWQRQADGNYTVVDMGALMDEDHYSYAHAVNDSGNAVGASVVGTVSPTSSTSLYHGFVYHDGEMVDVGSLGYHPTYVHSELKDINATDQFVGSVTRFYNFAAFGGAAVLGELVAGQTAMIDLNQLVDQGSGWTFLSAEGINDGRSIVGYGTFDGMSRAFLLTPVSARDDESIFGNVATVTIDVNPQPDAPVAVDDAYVVGRGSSVHGNVLFNDWDADGDPLVAELGATVMKGNLSFAADGSFVYTPSSGFDGSDSFVYSVRDGSGAVSTATVVIGAAQHRTFDTMLSGGHADIGLALGEHDHADDDGHDHGHDHGHHDEDPRWNLHIHDEENDAEHDPADALLYVGMGGYTQRTGEISAPEFDFLGAAGDEFFYVLPAIETPGLLFLGLGTEEIAEGTLLDGIARLQLKSVNGPGEFSLWETGPEGVRVLMATSDGTNHADHVVVQEHAHRHVNYGFSKSGLYEITVQATGTLADGDTLVSEDVTYFFQVGNTVSEIDVAGGQQQRSFVRSLDLTFASDEGLSEIADQRRIRLTQYDVNGENGFDVLDPARIPALSVAGNVLHLDFGSHGIGGNRSTTLGNGLYRVSVDVDGDGAYDVDKYFHRLFGDVDGDGAVSQSDLDQIIAAIGTNDPESDVDGSRRVNAIDRILASRSLGQQLADGIGLDD